MLAFTLHRAIQAIGVMIAVGIIAFSMFRFAGDPVNQIVSLDTPPAERAAVRQSLGLDDPVIVQFARYVGNAAQFKFGVSYQFRQPVTALLMVRIGWWTTGLLTVSGLKALIMPSVTLGLFQMTLIMRLVRAEMLEVLRTDYIRFARARGLTTRAIHFGHALKNTLVPVITVAGLQFGSVIAFAIITETVFQWPGMGLMFVQAVQNVDIPIMAAYLLFVSLIFVTINFVVDILYTVVDPRLRSTISGAA